ncbi:MAG: GAF domain-containing protein [Desulfobacterales bacterium]|nr:GAF domain-containing protein [Desulfobacterales bacterium]
MSCNENMLQALLTITQLPTSKVYFKEKLQNIITEISKCMNSKKASIMLLKNKKYLEVSASTSKELIGIKQLIDINSPSGWVFKNKKILYVDNSNSSLFRRDESKYDKDAFLICPIILNNRVIGVICLTEKTGNDSFSREEQELLLNISSNIISVLEIHRLTESLKKHKSSLNEKNRSLIKLEKIRTELFSMLIHDLKGPISEIVANLDILFYTVSSENLEYLEAAQAGCETLFRMISNLLDISRMEEGSLKLLLERIEPKGLIREAVSRLPGVIKIKGIKILEKFPEEDKRLIILGDREILLRVMQNLLMNAIRYSSQDGTIEVGFEDIYNERVTFFIKDNGPGVPEHLQETIFDKFFQVKTEHKQYSVGLGLTFCKLAVSSHKGKIFVESDGKSGSSFKFALPIEHIEKSDDNFEI